MTDEQCAKFVTENWLNAVAAVPVDEVSLMVCEDPSTFTVLVGAVRHERTRRDELERQLATLRDERDRAMADVESLTYGDTVAAAIAITERNTVADTAERIAAFLDARHSRWADSIRSGAWRKETP